MKVHSCTLKPLQDSCLYCTTLCMYINLSLVYLGVVCDCSSVFPDQLEIVQDFSRSALPTNVAEIGRELRINFALTNSGPSTIGQGRLTIHLPYRTPCTRNSFLFYILSVSVCFLVHTYMCECVVCVFVCVHACVRACVCTTVESTLPHAPAHLYDSQSIPHAHGIHILLCYILHYSNTGHWPSGRAMCIRDTF